MKPTRGFSADVGQRSTGAGGPDQIEYDIDQLCKMFDPLQSGGGIGTENIQLLAITAALIANGTIDLSKLNLASVDTRYATTDYVASQIGALLLQQIPVGTITNSQLATDAKVGSLATSTTTEKSNVVNITNEINQHVSYLETLRWVGV